MFGWMRFFTGLGVGALVATTGALVSEYAPKGKKNLCNAITYSTALCRYRESQRPKEKRLIGP
jgi:MFS family permease